MPLKIKPENLPFPVETEKDHTENGFIAILDEDDNLQALKSFADGIIRDEIQIEENGKVTHKNYDYFLPEQEPEYYFDNTLPDGTSPDDSELDDMNEDARRDVINAMNAWSWLYNNVLWVIENNAKGLLLCSFCMKSQEEVMKIICGPNVTICNECIGQCNDIITEDVDR